MGWAHEGAAISSTATSATWIRVAGLGGGGLESAAACCFDKVPGPTGAVPGPMCWSQSPQSSTRGPPARSLLIEGTTPLASATADSPHWFCSWKRLSQWVFNIQIRMYFANLYVSLLDQISDGVEESLDVFGLFMKSGFLRQGNRSSIVTKDFTLDLMH